MKFKKHWKRFWTLSSRHDGFTLVELIVVIAILAILAGVAVPAYSGYVKKANMQADISLASEVAHALTLHYYNTPGTTGGYVVLAQEGDESTADEAGTAAMVAAFGDEWAKTAVLKYDGWTDAATLLNLVANNAYAGSVNDSSYITGAGTEVLLGDVQNCASSLAALMASVWTGGEGADELDELIGGNGAVKNMLSGYKDTDITADVLANATVFGIANTMADSASASTVVNGFGDIENNYIGNASNLSTSSLADVAHTYAALEAMVAYLNNDEATAAFNKLNETGFNSTNPNTILENIRNTCTAVTDAGGTDVLTYYGFMIDENGDVVPDPSVSKSQAQLDGEAYTAIMQTVNNLSSDYTGSLSNSNLFGTTEMANRVNSYVTAASLTDQIDGSNILSQIAGGNFGDSAIVVVFSLDSNGNPVCQSLPADAMP